MDDLDSRGIGAAIIRRARWLTGLTQAELAERMGVPQSTVSAYQRGARRPTVDTLARMVDAAGLRLTWELAHGGSGGGPLARLVGPVGRRVVMHREEIVHLLAERGLTNPRVIGEVADGRDWSGSHLSLVVDLPAEATLTPMQLLATGAPVGVLTGGRVLILTTRSALHQGYTEEDVAEAVPLESSGPER